MPVEVLTVDWDLPDPNGELAGCYRIEDTGAVLVRPDGFVAWHCPVIPGDPAAALAEAVSGALGSRPDALTRAAGC